jgi:hypothetical protein
VAMLRPQAVSLLDKVQQPDACAVAYSGPRLTSATFHQVVPP